MPGVESRQAAWSGELGLALCQCRCQPCASAPALHALDATTDVPQPGVGLLIFEQIYTSTEEPTMPAMPH